MPLLRARAWMQTKLPACLIAAFMCSGLIVKPAGALSPEIEISQYAHTAWRMQDGIFPAKPNSFAQTSDGYVWIGTGDGLLRFDGIRFSPWKPQGQQLSDSFIWSLLAAHDGTLWIGTKSGLEHLVNGRLAAFPDVRATVPSILQDENGTIWMTRAHVKPADKRGPICKVVGARVQCFGGGEGIPDVDADPLAEDHLGNLWISGETGLTRWRPGSVSNYSQAGSKGKKFSDSIEAICPAPDGSVWVGSFQSGEGLGLQRLSQDVWSSILLPGLNSSTLKVAALYLDAAGALWIGTMDNGIYGFMERKSSTLALPTDCRVMRSTISSKTGREISGRLLRKGSIVFAHFPSARSRCTKVSHQQRQAQSLPPVMALSGSETTMVSTFFVIDKYLRSDRGTDCLGRG